jgi:acyl carrier protein
MTTRDDIAEITIELIAAELKTSPSEIHGADALKLLPGADSLKLLRVVSKLERRWEVEFDDEAIFAAKTVDELVTLVEKTVSGDLLAP